MRNKEIVNNIDLQQAMIEAYIKEGKVREIVPLLNDYTLSQQTADAYKQKNKEIAYQANLPEGCI
jgi:hypothetical protein